MKWSTDSAGAQKPGFFWRGVLILLPLVLLAGVGIYSLRQDRLLVEVEAKERCQAVAGEYARRIAAMLPLRGLVARERSTITVDSRGGLEAIGASRSRATMIEGAVPRPLPEMALTAEQRQAWDAARRAQFLKTENAVLPLTKFISLAPPKIFLTQARYDLALQYAAGHGDS